MEKIFLTGASGYLGSAFLRHYSSKFNVVAFGRSRPEILQKKIAKNVSFIKGDLSSVSLRSIGDAVIIVHLAAVKGSGQCAENPDEARKANVLGTRNLLKAATASGARRFIFASTYWVYGGKPPFKENQGPRPLETYGMTKLESEKDIIASGMDYSTLRFSNIFGHGAGINCDDIVFTFLKRAFEGKPLLLHNGGKNRIDVIEVRDACEIMARIIKDSRARGIFNVGSGKPISISSIASVVSEVLKNDYGLDVGVKSVESGQPPPDRYFSIAKLEKQLGKLNLRDFKESVREYAGSYKRHLR